MVPTETVASHKTSLDSQPTHAHAIFQNPEVVEEELRTFVGKPPSGNPIHREVFQKQNPQVPNLMGPK